MVVNENSKLCYLMERLEDDEGLCIQRKLNILDNAALWDFLKGWLKKFEKTSENNYAEKFIFLWVSVNAWLSKSVPDITQNHKDEYLIACLSKDKKFQTRFNCLLESISFKELIKELWELLPIFQSLWLSNEQIPPWNKEHRNRMSWLMDVIPKIKREPFTPYAPKCFLQHNKRGEEIPRDWPHVISVIYQIRCNLFHGGKSYSRESDRLFLKLAYEILWQMWEEEIPEYIRQRDV